MQYSFHPSLHVQVSRHCEERAYDKLHASKAAVSIRHKRVTKQSPFTNELSRAFSMVVKSLHRKVRARRLLRGCSNDKLNEYLAHSQLSLAMTHRSSLRGAFLG